MILPILHWPDPLLAKLATPVTPSAATAQLAEDMLETMYAAEGRGLAAPQVGQLLRLFVMDLTWKEDLQAPQVFLNPEITARSEMRRLGAEGCLSIPGPVTMIERPAEIGLRWQDLDGAWHEASLTGMAAICAQHEIDHLDGVVTLDHLDPVAREQAEAEIIR